MALSFVMCLCSCACLCVSVMLGAGMCRCSGPLRSRRAKKKLIKKEYCRCGPHPLQVTSSRARPYLLRERAALAPFSRNSGVDHAGLWPPLHCGDSRHLHRRLFQAPHCTLRLSHLSVGGNARGLEIVGQLDM